LGIPLLGVWGAAAFFLATWGLLENSPIVSSGTKPLFAFIDTYITSLIIHSIGV